MKVCTAWLAHGGVVITGLGDLGLLQTGGQHHAGQNQISIIRFARRQTAHLPLATDVCWCDNRLCGADCRGVDPCRRLS